MTREERKLAKRRALVRDLALCALCIVIGIGVSYLAEYIMPAAI